MLRSHPPITLKKELSLSAANIPLLFKLANLHVAAERWDQSLLSIEKLVYISTSKSMISELSASKKCMLAIALFYAAHNEIRMSERAHSNFTMYANNAIVYRHSRLAPARGIYA